MRVAVNVSILKPNYVDLDSDISGYQESQPLQIGVFDSGVGGLTVLQELHRQLPHESYLYFGDTARVPYGNRSQAEILTFVREILTWMQQQQVKMAIMACNTSSALALDLVRQEFDLPILGLILPGARAAVQQGCRIGVIATPATVTSDGYRQAMLEINPQVQVWQVACPEFVPLVEQNRIHQPETVEIVRQYLQPLLQEQIDTLVYGCTHYPYLAPVINTLLPPTIGQVNPAVHLVAAAVEELKLLGLRNPHLYRATTRFCVSGCPQQFAQLSQQWLGYLPNVEQIVLPAVAQASLPLESSSEITF